MAEDKKKTAKSAEEKKEKKAPAKKAETKAAESKKTEAKKAPAKKAPAKEAVAEKKAEAKKPAPKAKKVEVAKPNQAKAFAKYMRTSPQKLNLVAQTIRGKNASRAMIDLEFSKKRIAQDVRKLLQSAIANAENNHGMDVDNLVVVEAWVGNQIKMKRFHARARGRGARIEKRFSNMTIIVQEAV